MVPQDQTKTVSSGSGFTIGELTLDRHPQLRYLKKGALVTQFDGVDVMLDFIAKNMTEAKEGKASVRSERSGFNAFETYDEALTIFRGDPQKVVKFDPAELRIKDANEAGSNVEYDVTGDSIDMGRYMEGIPETVGSMHSGNSRNRRVNFVINLSQWHGINHEDITHRGERILRLVDALEGGGVRTQITGIESTECGHFEVTLKHHEEPLTVSDLAVVTHPEFLRRILFRVKENSKTWDWGYGSAVDFSNALTPELIATDLNDELAIVIDANMSGKSTIDEYFDQLERLLVWEMSKPVPEVTSVKMDKRGIYFNPNGARSDAEIRQEGLEVIREQ